MSEQTLSPKSKWSIRAKVAVGFGIVLILGCVIFISWISSLFRGYEPFTSTNYQPVPTDIYEIEAMEGNAEIKLPPSAREIYSYTTGFQEIFVMVRFTINADELPLFLESTLCNEPLRKVSPSLQSSHSYDQAWWEPNLAVELASCGGGRELSEATHFGQEILVDTTSSEYYIIYVTASMY